MTPICNNCGLPYELHRYSDNACPRNGHEDENWSDTTYDPSESKTIESRIANALSNVSLSDTAYCNLVVDRDGHVRVEGQFVLDYFESIQDFLDKWEK